MSLEKIYRLRCEGPSLARRLGLAVGAQQFVKVQCYGRTLTDADSSVKARREALKAGWSRRRENFPVLPDHPDAGSSLVSFDLCPSCTDLVPRKNA